MTPREPNKDKAPTPPDDLNARIGVLTRREVEARILGPVIEALGESFLASVVSISPLADTLGGDVVYEVTLTFSEPPVGLLGGMTAEVAIDELDK